MSSWYYSHGTKRWNWNKNPTYRCPYDRRSAEASTPVAVQQAAEVLKVDTGKFWQLLQRSHTGSTGQRERVDGKLTDRCVRCGARMTRRGFRAWVDDDAGDTPDARIAGRLGFQAPRATVEERWFDTKKEAADWADRSRRAAKGGEDTMSTTIFDRRGGGPRPSASGHGAPR